MARLGVSMAEFVNVSDEPASFDKNGVKIENEVDIVDDEENTDEDSTEDTQEDEDDVEDEKLELKRIVSDLKNELDELKHGMIAKNTYADLDNRLVSAYSDYEDALLGNDTSATIQGLESVVSVIIEKLERNRNENKNKTDQDIIKQVQIIAPEYGVNSKFTNKFDEKAKQLLNNPKYVRASIEEKIKWVKTEVKSDLRSVSKLPTNNSGGVDTNASVPLKAIQAVIAGSLNTLTKEQAIAYLKENPHQLKRFK